MSIKLSPDQQMVVDARGKNILVSAAAGSGKTAVLVRRIIERITEKDNPIDIDRLLVVTFTSAAAAEMRERVSKAIEEKLALEPYNVHLQRQAILVHQAQITTIHSFCLFLVKNHFEEIALEPDFKVADEAMVKLISSEIKEQVLEEAFTEGKESFLQMVEFICHNGKERNLEDYIEQLYERAMSMPFPKRWLLERKQDYNFQNLDEFTKTDSGKYLYLHMLSLIKNYAEAYGQLYEIATQPDGPYMYADLLEQEKETLLKIARQKSLEGIGKLLPNMEFNDLSKKRDKSVNAEKREWVKEKRNSYKEKLQALSKQFFSRSPQGIEMENSVCMQVTEALVDITLTYMERLASEKRRRGIVDFHDMEHMALQILLKETEDGYEPTEIARSYQQFFEEVMVDEYQDSNMVQEYLVTAVSGKDFGKNNLFMVGDVKQSIYKFRLARPELFMEKYHKYVSQNSSNHQQKKEDNENIRIDLKQNFRSRKEILQAANSVFEKVMLPELGGIAYDSDAALYPAATYIDSADTEVELIIASEESPKNYDSKQWEAYCVCKRIQELIQNSQVLEGSGDSFRPVTYGDIVLLFRSLASFEEAYKSVFEEQGIPIVITSGTGYFDAVEVQNLLKLLQSIENPRLDIPMFCVCTSIFGGMTENELTKVKVHYNNVMKSKEDEIKKSEQCLYDMLCIYKKDNPNDEMTEKISRLQQMLQKYRRQMEYLTVAELLYEILRDFHYKEYISVLSDGEKRLANVALLLEKASTFGAGSYQGLFAFTSYMNQLHKQAIDYGEAGSVVNSNAVRVMTIHKSKGLQFPVVIVCGMGQHYQMRDKRQMLLIDNDMGLGMDYIDVIERRKNKTLRKNVIALKMEHEILAEEQRLLYVAMTRAKEKLIMAGYKSKYKAVDAPIQGQKVCMLSDVLEAKSYLDLCLLAKQQSVDNPIKIRLMTAEDYVVSEISQAISLEERKENLFLGMTEEQSQEIKTLQDMYESRFEYQYPYENLRNLYSKTSVSDLKKNSQKEEQEAVFEPFDQADEVENVSYMPEFMREEAKMSSAERGLAYHRVFELLDFTNPPKNYTSWKDTLAQMVTDGKLSKRQQECIYVKKMQEFMQSNVAKRMKNAAMQGKLHKEQSFFLGIPANLVDEEFPKEEMMLVQGMIDAYFEEEEGLVLVDYKTDYITSAQELIERYQVQMEYYTKALERAMGKNVKEVILYSLALGEECRC